MSGHSKWAGIKHKKAIIDAKKGKVFSKFAKEISVAAKAGGGDLSGNARLRLAVDKAKAVNMPSDNIKKAIQRGTGELPGQMYEELVYEGYGPGGVAVLIEATTDNKNRTSSELRKIFSKNGGNMGEAGCVGWMFSKKGYISVSKKSIKEEDLMNLVLETGAEDMLTDDEDFYEVITSPDDFEKVRESVSAKGLESDTSELTMLPQTYIKLEGKPAEQMLRLMEDLEEHDDVQNAHSNFDISKEEMERIEGGQ